MRCCWGVSDMLPESVIAKLPRGTTYGYPDTTLADVLIVPEIDTLRRIWPTVKDQDVAVIVFDAEVRLQFWQIPPLDMSVPLTKQLRSTNTIKYRARNHIKQLLNKTAKSFVSNFVTLVYKNRDPEKQAQLRNEVFGAVWKGERVKYASKVNKKATELLTLLNSEDAINLEQALQEIRANKPVNAVAKAHGIASFDLNYVIKFMSK